MKNTPRPRPSPPVKTPQVVAHERPEGIHPEQSLELLKALHILTREGQLNQDSRRKLKQVYHLVQFIRPLLETALEHQPEPLLIDHGAGKSYLGFLLYDLILKAAGRGRVVGIETRTELIQRSQELAAHLSFDRMSFLNRSVEDSITSHDLPPQVDIVTALHACDTATDDAIRFALHKKARAIVLVPCCQAEVAAALRAAKNTALSATPLAELWRHPIHSRELGSHLTNVLRCLLLEAHGYQVTVTELVGWEHSMKNELIIAERRTPATPRGNARSRTQTILDTFHLQGLSERFAYVMD